MLQALWEDDHTALKPMESFREVNFGTLTIELLLCFLLHFTYYIMILICHLHSYLQFFFKTEFLSVGLAVLISLCRTGSP